MGIVEGPHVFDLCGECFLPEDPLFNQTCPELFRVFVPTIFDPGSFADSRFGLFTDPENLGQLLTFQIIDRWGNLMFEIKDTPLVDVEVWWDGRYNGVKVDPGVYIYRYVIEYPDVENDISQGTLTLIR